MTRTQRKHAIASLITSLEKRIQKLKARSSKLSRARLIIFLSGFALGTAFYYMLNHTLGWLTFAITILIFNIVAYIHRTIEKSAKRHQIWLEQKQSQIARMELNWEKIPFRATPAPDGEHPFEVDLNITGKYSLHHLIDTSVSHDGGKYLQELFLQPKLDAEAIRQRQSIVRELMPQARFRDKLHLAFRLVTNEAIDGKKLLHFLGKQNANPQFNTILKLSAALALANITLYLLNVIGILPAWWILSLILYGGLYLGNQGAADSLLDDSVFISEELKKLKAVLLYLEKYRYGKHQALKEFCKPFWYGDSKPSAELKKITVLNIAVGLRMNPLFRLILNIIVPWDFYLVKLLNKAEAILSGKLQGWLKRLVELEALNSLANFAYLNPEATFPEINPQSNQPLAVENIGHPLINYDARQNNNFTFAEKGRVALITGSNMSGKSTFLKTLGVNLVLAFAGGSALASSMQTGLFRLYTSIQINDSITDGFSFFYAEVRRLKALLNALQNHDELPLLFLIDEIFKGTNNRERLIGSRSYIKRLAGQNGLGAISTHDLELTNLSNEIPKIANFHFREEVENGKMVFDYQIHTGPCPSTNALKIMQLEGLPVDL